MTDLAVVILTHNEERHIARALRSVADIATERFVVDSFSTDSTVAVARAEGAVVLQHPFENYARQFQWALDNAPITAGWVMRLDADEVVEPDLAEEIGRRLPRLGPETVGINLKRKHIFLGRWIRHGGRWPLVLLRIWRHGHGRIEDRWMDEHMIVSGGAIVTFRGAFADHNLNDLTFFISKHNRYASREAIDILNQRFQLFPREDLSLEKTSFQAVVKRLLKERFYNKLPLGFGSFLYFLWRYFGQLGFLDGQQGLIYHFLQAYWYRFLVSAKVYELENLLEVAAKSAPPIELLEQATGLSLSTPSAVRDR